VGQWLLEKWKRSEDLCEAIGFHHNPRHTKSDVVFDLAGIIHLADIFTRAIGIGNGGDNRIPEISGVVAERFQGLLESNLVGCFREIPDAMKKASSFLKFL